MAPPIKAPSFGKNGVRFRHHFAWSGWNFARMKVRESDRITMEKVLGLLPRIIYTRFHSNAAGLIRRINIHFTQVEGKKLIVHTFGHLLVKK